MRDIDVGMKDPTGSFSSYLQNRCHSYTQHYCHLNPQHKYPILDLALGHMAIPLTLRASSHLIQSSSGPSSAASGMSGAGCSARSVSTLDGGNVKLVKAASLNCGATHTPIWRCGLNTQVPPIPNSCGPSDTSIPPHPMYPPTYTHTSTSSKALRVSVLGYHRYNLCYRLCGSAQPISMKSNVTLMITIVMHDYLNLGHQGQAQLWHLSHHLQVTMLHQRYIPAMCGRDKWVRVDGSLGGGGDDITSGYGPILSLNMSGLAGIAHEHEQMDLGIDREGRRGNKWGHVYLSSQFHSDVALLFMAVNRTGREEIPATGGDAGRGKTGGANGDEHGVYSMWNISGPVVLVVAHIIGVI
ncbi:hypothetical protein EDC04DRAFT_2609916 [Pisolithus marmoratus]|nr:hypothetical protein EDC04DRAFT_2609916 [Pisolithus marmoratus]